MATNIATRQLEKKYANVGQVFEAHQKGEVLYLNQDLNPTNDLSKRIGFLEAVTYVNQQKWDLTNSDNFKKTSIIWTQLSKIYSDDPHANKLSKVLFNALVFRAGKKDIIQYQDDLASDLYCFHEIRGFIKNYIVSKYATMRLIEIEKHAGEFGLTINENPAEKGQSMFIMRDPQVTTSEGVAFLMTSQSVFNMKNLGENSHHDRKLLKKIEKAMVSKNEEVQRMAYAIKFIYEVSTTSINSDRLIDIFSSEYKVLLGQEAKGTFQTLLNEYFPTFGKALAIHAGWSKDITEDAEKGTMSEIFDERDERYFRDQIVFFPQIIEELRNSEKTFSLLEKEHCFVRERLRATGKVRVHNLPSLSGEIVQNWKPSLIHYCNIQIPTENPFQPFLLTPFPMKLKEKAEEEFISPSKEKEPEPQVLDLRWKEVIGLRGGIAESLEYAYHVTRWADNPQEPLQEEKYSNLPRGVKEKVTLFHTPPPIVRELIGTNYSLETKTHNPRTKQTDKVYSIPAQIAMKDGKGTYTGFYNFIRDSRTGVVYHGCFSDKTDNFANAVLRREVMDKQEYPTIEQSVALKKAKSEKLEGLDLPMRFNSVLKSVEVETPTARIHLFCVEKRFSELAFLE